MPRVSVLMPCYNAAATLPAALSSLAEQTLADFEIVVVDDGSQDETPDVLAAWARLDTRLKVLKLPHGGIIPALNFGLDACQAPYIARMDADDRAAPRRLASQLAFLQAHPEVAVVGCLVSAFPPEGVRGGFQVYLEWLNGLVTDAEIRREIFVESPLPHPSVMFRADPVRSMGGYQDFGWAEDYDLWLRLYRRGCRFGKVPEVLLEWREHPQRLTRVDPRYSLENFLRAKAFYLADGPLAGRDAVLIWGAGMIGRRISKYLLRQGQPLRAFIDIDPKKIGRTRRGVPVLNPQALPDVWQTYQRPVLLAAVGARGARQLIRSRLNELGLVEAQDWWSVA